MCDDNHPSLAQKEKEYEVDYFKNSPPSRNCDANKVRRYIPYSKKYYISERY